MTNNGPYPTCGHLVHTQCGPENYSCSELIEAQEREINSLRRTIAQLRGSGAGRTTLLSGQKDETFEDWADELMAQMDAVARTVGPTILDDLS
ncbi:hypothetical protein ABZ468_38490 [Streptomyces sp. NPDC005708]|uniref:hypothetical protein n=1 Tax=Streptomyces sp. NPDC005708 TaxID=3154564 RepID=UPI0033E3A2C1